MKASTTEH